MLRKLKKKTSSITSTATGTRPMRRAMSNRNSWKFAGIFHSACSLCERVPVPSKDFGTPRSSRMCSPSNASATGAPVTAMSSSPEPRAAMTSSTCRYSRVRLPFIGAPMRMAVLWPSNETNVPV